MKKILRYIIINNSILIIIYLFYINNLRVCLAYNLFHVPCVGCGLTRSIISIFKLDFANSIRYNILGIPLVILFFLYNIWYFFDIITRRNTLKETIQKYKKIITIIAILLFVVCTYRNLYNQLLY